MKFDVLTLKAWMIFTPLIVVIYLPMLIMPSGLTDKNFMVQVVYGQAGSIVHWTLFVLWLTLINEKLDDIVVELGRKEKSNRTSLKLIVFLVVSAFVFFSFAYAVIHLKLSISQVTQYLMIPNLFAFTFFLWAIKDIAVKVLYLETDFDPSVRELLWTGFVILFYPLGIWGFQRRLNALRKKYPR